MKNKNTQKLTLAAMVAAAPMGGRFLMESVRYCPG